MARTAAGTPPSRDSRLLLAIFIFFGMIVVRVRGDQRTWCVAKPSSYDQSLMANINYACSEVDCGVLQRGAACFYPDNLISHASVAMNLYYQSRGRNFWNCYFKNSGIITTTDPSYGSCVYGFGTL